jgi:hypothetical protein
MQAETKKLATLLKRGQLFLWAGLLAALRLHTLSI